MILPLYTDCDSYGTGPLGTVFDGCGDAAEGAALASLTVAFAAASYQKPEAIAAAFLVCTSTFHLVFGEGTIKGSLNEGISVHSVLLVAVNTREVTVPVVTACACRTFGGIGLLYSTMAVALAATVSWVPAIYYAGFDAAGVVIGTVLFFKTQKEKEVSG